MTIFFKPWAARWRVFGFVIALRPASLSGYTLACARAQALVKALALAGLLATLIAFTPGGAAQAQTPSGFNLQALQALLRQQQNAQARFTEQRFVSGLDQALRSSGTLSFTAPNRFSRVTLEPHPESMEVDGNAVTLKRGGRTRRMTLDALPEATALVEALRGILNGDLVLLQKYYRTKLEGDSNRWRLNLTPLDLRLSSQVRQLDIEGQGAQLRSVEVLLAGGDRSLMTIEALPSAPANAKSQRPASP